MAKRKYAPYKEYVPRIPKEYVIRSIYTAIGYCIARHELELVSRDNATYTATLVNKNKELLYLSKNSQYEWELENDNGDVVDVFTKHNKRSIVGSYNK